jgi:hypothetical protein
MEGTGVCKLPATPSSTGFSSIQHLNMKVVKICISKHPQMKV